MATPTPHDARLANRIAAIRRFNRYYTRRLGILNDAMLGSDLSLPEVRVMWELGHDEATTATYLGAMLGLDAGYLSRILRSLRDDGLVQSVAAEHDARSRHLQLTPKGRKRLGILEERSSQEVGRAITLLSAGEQDRLVDAMRAIEALLEGRTGPWPYALREPRAGDYGWIIHRHGELYAREYGWDETFEGLVAEIVARFAKHHDPRRERCWLAESNGAIAGCVLLVRRSASVAQLRCLLVEPFARGLGVGSALVRQCVAFARAARYRNVTLWTNSVLDAARHIYESQGFRLVKEEAHQSFGKHLVGENWELALTAPEKSAARATRGRR